MHRNFLAGLGALTLAFGAVAHGTPARALGDNDYLGSVALVANNYCPRGTLEAAGQVLPIAQYANLFSLLTTTYGGDGKNTFKLPDLRGKSPVDGARYCIVIDGVWPQRN